MGGDESSDSISHIVIKSIKSFFIANSDSDYLDRLKTSIIETNDFIFNHSNGNSALKKMATTIELLYLKSNTAYIAHIGDSRIYHLKNGRLKKLTKDHSLIQKLLDEGYLTYRQAVNHPEKNVVLKAIGEKVFIDADLMKVKLNKYDKNKFFICSDGVTSNLSDRDLESILDSSDCESILDTLPDIILGRGAQDDYSFIYIEGE
jgi:protein phosphatase